MCCPDGSSLPSLHSKLRRIGRVPVEPGAAALGPSGAVNSAKFQAILEGRDPDGPHLGRRGMYGEAEHRPGRDVTKSEPRSVALMAMAGGDERKRGMPIVLAPADTRSSPSPARAAAGSVRYRKLPRAGASDRNSTKLAAVMAVETPKGSTQYSDCITGEYGLFRIDHSSDAAPLVVTHVQI